MQDRRNPLANLMMAANGLTLASLAVLASSQSLAGPSAMELEIVRNAKLSLIDAVELAEREVDGRVVEAELDEDDDMFFYKLEVVTEDGLTLLYVNPASGVIVGRRGPGLRVGARSSGHADRAAAVSGTAGSLVKALRTAESQTGGRAVDIETERDDDRYVFEVTTIQDGLEHEVEIDLQSGRVLDIDEDD